MGSSCECMVVSNKYSKQNILLENKTHFAQNHSNVISVNNSDNQNQYNKLLSFVNNTEKTFSSSVYKEENFELMLLNEINHVRTSPQSYVNKLKKLLTYVQHDNNACVLIYNKEKIILNKGIQTFYETIDILNSMQPLRELQLNEEIRITLQNNVNTTSNKTAVSSGRKSKRPLVPMKTLKQVLFDKKATLLKKYSKCFFTYDIFKNPELSVVFQITDEAFQKSRRNILLSPDINYFATYYFYNNKNQFTSVSTFV